MSLTAPSPFLVIEPFVSAPYDLGDVGLGGRRCVPITGGEVSGEIQGEILPGGADWQTVRKDGVLLIEARFVIRTGAGALIDTHVSGIRSGPAEVLARMAAGEAVAPTEYYFRAAVRFDTAASGLERLTQQLAVARGERQPGRVRLETFAVL